MKFYRDIAVEAIEDAKGAEHLDILGADWFENRTLNLMESIENERDAASKIGALLVVIGTLLEKVRSADPSHGLTPVRADEVMAGREVPDSLVRDVFAL